MTSTTFEKCLRKPDFQMRNSARKMAMVLDNCTAHPNIIGLTNIKLVFLPSNATAKTQPLDSSDMLFESALQKEPYKIASVSF